MNDRDLWQALGYRVEKRSLGVCGDGYVLFLPDGGYGPGCGEGRGWGNEPAAWAQLPSPDTGDGMLRIMEAMASKDWRLRLDVHDLARSFAEFRNAIPGRYGPASADTAPCAVRLAALRALGVSDE